ncbi:unnamed protein product [Rangifer tarandus platyrhynchus]|uniref:Uncharacterized protein n=1 Tax=Rangifer tarandus platyrhynchus TaxID=3082113 RepID=A0AC59Y4A1_RANTA
MYEGVFFTHPRNPPPLAHFPSSLLVPASPGAVLISEYGSHFFSGQRSPRRVPPRAVPRPLSCLRTNGAVGINLRSGNNALKGIMTYGVLLPQRSDPSQAQ